jgi:radical SAM protein with 4Fe4S-binding SPASM domain
MIAVSSSGEVVPCLQMSGYFMENKISLANIKTMKLKDIVNNTKYTEYSMAPILKRILNNNKCANCDYFKACTGGCPALGLLYSGESHDYYHEDITKCSFFNNGWYGKIVLELGKWKLLNPLEI